ncbi:4'-phosphopantetheinyl transferase family protein [Saccharomonospora iraqiensis]|uniref:4'-phosphopantetheinyl transferase family protein n=1 Tax=Saccharomonospora iraqiensis TaxID=52698 RepID=UPI00022E0B4F|nr:4'-phosphopantetheinyl transferase superfamily protein [Saccharomonospora iraqiensis]
MTECAVWWTTPMTVTDDALGVLDRDEHARYGAYRRAEDRSRFLTGRVLAKTVAAARLGGRAHEIRFDARCADCGRPHGPVRIPGSTLELSVSHSGDRVGVAATDGTAVGLDVEAAGRDVDDSLRAYVLNETELAGLDGCSGPVGAEAFFRFWTRKEAVMKATRRGLRIPLRALTISGPDEPPRLLASADDAVSAEAVRLADLDPGPGYRAAVAVLTDGAAPDEIDVTERWWDPGTRTDGQ